MSSKKWNVKLTRQAERDLKYWRKTDEQVFQKCLQILKLLEVAPTNLNTPGHPEWLKGPLSGCMSRRITYLDRYVYQVLKKEKSIKVL